MPNPLDDYFAALDRLAKGRPTTVPKGTKISNDSVALEAGRKKGSIKKSRPVFADIIAAIDEAAALQNQPRDIAKERLANAKGSSDKYRNLWEAALAREISLLDEVVELRMQIQKLTGKTVFSMHAYQNKKGLNTD